MLIIQWVGWPALWIAVSLFSQSLLVITQWAHEQSYQNGRGGGFALTQQDDFHSSRLTWLLPPLSAQSASSRDQHWVINIAPFPRVLSQLPGGRSIIMPASIMEGNHFVLTGINNYSDIDLPSLHAMLLPKLPSMDLENVSWSGVSLYSKQNAAMGPSSWNSLVLPCSPLSWGNWLDQMVEWPFEDSIITLATW